MQTPVPTSILPPQPDFVFKKRARAKAGFTLVEILIVVVILGILAAIVIPQFADASETTRRSAFVTDLTQMTKQAQIFMSRHGFLEDASTGVIPEAEVASGDGSVASFGDLIPAAKWEAGPTIGGSWDTEYDNYGVTSALGVHFNGVTPKDDTYMTQIDDLVDDGDLTTGAFQKFANDRFYWVLMP